MFLLGLLQQTGFTASWLPPVSKATNIGGMSMGYDPYDYYDLGEFDQKRTTRIGGIISGATLNVR